MVHALSDADQNEVNCPRLPELTRQKEVPATALPVGGFLIVGQPWAVLVLQSMFGLEIDFGRMFCSFAGDALC